MGDHDEIPQRVNPGKEPCLDGLTQPHSPTSMSAAVSKVLDDDNLLAEIIIRVGFPTFLVRAALVCKHWLCHISDRKFLSRFRKLNPPRLLGVYIDNWLAPRFVPMLPQPPELATVVGRMVSHSFGAQEQLETVDCRNGGVFTRCLEGEVLVHGVYWPLCPERGLCIIPPLPTTEDPFQLILGTTLSKEGDGLSYLYLLADCIREMGIFRMRVYMLQDGVWCIHASAIERILHPLRAAKAVLVGNKIYMAAGCGNDIFVLDLIGSSLSRIPLPHGVKYQVLFTALSRADDDSGVYLTHLEDNELQLHIWLHKGDNWLLVHTICLDEMLANWRMLDHTLDDDATDLLYLGEVGDNAEVVFLNMCRVTLYLDVTSRILHEVRGSAENDRHLTDVYPFMMIWPPTFPALKDDPARNAM